VQSEPAFDPFCLMDEQPDSAWTRVMLRPTPQTAEQQLVWEPFTGTLDTEIGCCGFPQRHSASESDLFGSDARQYHKQDQDEDDEDIDSGGEQNGHHVLGKQWAERDPHDASSRVFQSGLVTRRSEASNDSLVPAANHTIQHHL